MAAAADEAAAAAGGSGGDGVLEVVVFPWLAFGHMIPFLELAERLAARGHAVSFVSTPRNLARLPAPASPRVRLVPLPLPRVEGLPEGAESTADVVAGGGEDGLLKKAFDGLAAPFAAAFLADGDGSSGGRPKRRPDWIIHDFCHHWLPPVAHRHNVPCAVFWIVHAAFVAFVGPRWANTTGEHPPRTAPEDFTVPPKWMASSSSSSATAYRRHEAWWIAGTLSDDASGVSDMERTWRVLDGCRLTIYRSCEEVEPGMFDLLTHLMQKPAVPAGILLPSNIDNDDGNNSERVLRWLDDQPPKSVIYVALGSEAPLTGKDIHELALGLELAGVRFLWALRKPAGMFSSSTDEQLLPAGFEERTRARGLVCTGWVPQVSALAHGATGAFLTHCGWGSAVESLASGHPLVMLPFVVDQPLIGRMMVAKGIGVEVARDGKNGGGSFDRDGVAAAVRLVMVEEEGKVFASNAGKLRELLADQGRQERYMDGLVDHLRRYKDDN